MIAHTRRTIGLPKLHPDQENVMRLVEDRRAGDWVKNRGGRFRAVRCGRRWGKTELGKAWAIAGVTKGEKVSWYAPQHKTMREVYRQIVEVLEPVIVSKSQTDGVIRTLNGGVLEFWPLDSELASRGRAYHRSVIDEAAYTKPNTLEIWDKAIKPTLFDYTGRALVISNTRGDDPENFMWQLCNEPKHGFIEYHAPSIANPCIPIRRLGETDAEHMIRRLAAIQDIKERTDPLVFLQEYEAEFVSWDGVAFFSSAKLLNDGLPVAIPASTGAVFAVVDTAVKGGSEHDGTGVTYFAYEPLPLGGAKLTILDWDIIQIDGDLLDVWLNGVFETTEAWAKRCGARNGSLGVFIEDKQTGSVLIMAAQRRGMNAHAIDGDLTAAGKDGRAIAVSGYHYQGLIKISDEAFHKVTSHKGVTRNHFLSQVTGYRVGQKNGQDDLLDTYCYGISIALGDQEGI